MTTPGSTPKRGFLSNLSAALAPPVVTDDDPTKPLVRPRGIVIATICTALAGIAFLFVGTVTLTTMDQSLDAQVQTANTTIAGWNCPQYGGYGQDAKLPDGASTEVQNAVKGCQSISGPTVTPEMRANAESQATTIAWGVNILGALALVVAWFLFQGNPLARRGLVGLVVLTMIGTMLLQISSPITLFASLFIVVAVLLSYLGKGGLFFATALLRRKAR